MIPRDTVQLAWGLWEQETYAYITKALSADWMIDVGAGWGEMCALFALRSPASPIYAVEPMTGWRERIEDTLALNHVDCVTILPEYVGADFPLDDIPVGEGRGFIKIDVDGAEMEVLYSGEEMLRAKRPMILLETHSAELERQSIAFLETLGYRCKIIKNAWWRRIVPERRAWSDHNRWLWAE
jgi:precorrin-6B methylase 2